MHSGLDCSHTCGMFHTRIFDGIMTWQLVLSDRLYENEIESFFILYMFTRAVTVL